MKSFIIGLLVIISIIVFIYLLGIIPNIWSRKNIHFTDFNDVFERGFRILVIICATALAIFVIYSIGTLVTI